MLPFTPWEVPGDRAAVRSAQVRGQNQNREGHQSFRPGQGGQGHHGPKPEREWASPGIHTDGE